MEEGLREFARVFPRNKVQCLSVVCYHCRLTIAVVYYFKFHLKKKNISPIFFTSMEHSPSPPYPYKALVFQRPIMAPVHNRIWPQCPQNVCFFLWMEGRGDWRLIGRQDLFAEARWTGGKLHVHLRFLTPNRKLFISWSLERSANWIKQSQRYSLPRLNRPWTAPDIT